MYRTPLSLVLSKGDLAADRPPCHDERWNARGRVRFDSCGFHETRNRGLAPTEVRGSCTRRSDAFNSSPACSKRGSEELRKDLLL